MTAKRKPRPTTRKRKGKGTPIATPAHTRVKWRPHLEPDTSSPEWIAYIAGER